MALFLLILTPILAGGLAWLGYVTTRTNRLGWFLLLMGLAFVVGGPLYVWKWKGKPAPQKEERGDQSFWLVQPGFILAVICAPLEYLYLPPALPRGTVTELAGLCLVVAGVVWLSWARQAIRGQFAGHVQIQADHRLVQSGPYRLVRHPAYLGYLLLALGVAAGYSSLFGLAAVMLLLFPGLVYRMRVEEALLAEAFGDEYLCYAQRTRRLIPGIW